MKLEATWRRDPEGKGGTREALHGNNAYSGANSYRLSGEWDLLGDVRSDGAGGRNWTDVCLLNFRGWQRLETCAERPKLRTWVRFPSPAPYLTMIQLALHG